MKYILFILAFITFTTLYGQGTGTHILKNDAVTKNVKKQAEFRMLKDVITIGYNFYTFDELGFKGFYPTPYNIAYRRYLTVRRQIFLEAGWDYFQSAGGRGPYIWFRQYDDYPSREFNTVRLNAGMAIIDNLLLGSIGGCYKEGWTQHRRYEPGVGIIPVVNYEQSTGLCFALVYQKHLGKHFVIEPTARYEYYFNGVTSHYMLGVRAGFKF